MAEGFQEIINTSNVKQVDFDTLVEFLHDIYVAEVPTFAIDKTHHLSVLADWVVYFSNNYAFVMELWAICISHVRELRHTKAPKVQIDMAMDKRDYLDKVLSALKLKYYASARLLTFYSEPEYKHGG